MSPPRIDPRAVQGLVARGYGTLEHSAYLLLGINDVVHARAWLSVMKFTSAADKGGDSAVNLALTYKGLQALGLDDGALAGFPDELRQGMVAEHRSRQLGDHGDSAPALWDWGGVSPVGGIGTAAGVMAGASMPAQPARERREGEVEAGGTRQVWANEIDMLLLLYASSKAKLDELVDTAVKEEGKRGLTVFKVIRGSWLKDNKEHFGFADGIAQPGVAGLHGEGATADSIKAGEILIGYPNEYDRLPPSPQVAKASEHLGGEVDFGRDGSYLVVRQLEQDVTGFWKWVGEAADKNRLGEVFGTKEDPRIRLASKMVGRWPSGAPLALCPHADDPSKAEADEFGYAQDPPGMDCPIGAHVRRTNPRDFHLGGAGAESEKNSRRHRLLRRGRTYGEPLVDSMDPVAIAEHPGDNRPRGLMFACLNAAIDRQFEFVQHTWINSPKFGGLHDDADPLMGDHHPVASRSRAAAADPAFTLPAHPVRIRIGGIRRFVTVKGGGYFFLPSMRAIKYLGALS